MVECEQKHKFTPEEMEKIKVKTLISLFPRKTNRAIEHFQGNLLAEGIDPLSAQLEVTHESNLNEFCMNHRRMMVIHDHDFSKESLECAVRVCPLSGQASWLKPISGKISARNGRQVWRMQKVRSSQGWSSQRTVQRSRKIRIILSGSMKRRELWL